MSITPPLLAARRLSLFMLKNRDANYQRFRLCHIASFVVACYETHVQRRENKDNGEDIGLNEYAIKE